MTDIKVFEDTKEFEHFYEDMKQQFPMRELKSYEHFLELFRQGSYKLVACEYGYMFVVEEKETNMLWVDYFAIFKQFQSKGLGSRFLKELKALFPSYCGCYLEVEKADENDPNTIRRIKFYEKAGAINLDMTYYFPCKDEQPLAMNLYFLPFGFSAKKPDNKTILLSVKNVFHILHSDVPNFRDVLHRIACPARSLQAEQ